MAEDAEESGSKRKELSPEHIKEITRLFGDCKEVYVRPETRKSLSRQALAAGSPAVPLSRIFKNEDFGYRTFDEFVELDGWIRHRVRMCYWKQWRYSRTKVRHLVQLGVDLQTAIKHAISRKRYWRMSRTPAMRYAMPNKWLEQQGLLSLKHLWGQLAPLRGTA